MQYIVLVNPTVKYNTTVYCIGTVQYKTSYMYHMYYVVAGSGSKQHLLVVQVVMSKANATAQYKEEVCLCPSPTTT